jgi:gliding motility-associated protein GldE
VEPPNGELILYPASIFLSPGITEIVAFVLILLLLVCSALISGSEVAFFSLDGTHLKKLNESKKPISDRILELLHKPKRLLATILIANNFVNVGIVMLSTVIVAGVFDLERMLNWQILAIQTVAITFLLVLFGEVLPKVYATRYPLKLARIMARPLAGMRWLFTPLNELLVQSTSTIDKRFAKRRQYISVDALGHALELTEVEDSTDEELRILEGIVQFGNIDVKQVMQPRTDMVAIEESINFSAVLDQILEYGYSRMPVYAESMDKINGVLYIKDLLPHLSKAQFNWNDLVREAYFVPENKKLDDLLNDFKQKKVHMAIVVDEFGGTSGLVTMEDVIEEIVGEITDEFDDDEIQYSKLDDNTFVFEGSVQLNDMYRIMEIEGSDFEEHKGLSETLGGFILEQRGRFPFKGERVDFRNFAFVVEAVDKKKIRRVKVIRYVEV